MEKYTRINGWSKDQCKEYAKKINWCIEQHESTNHYYDKYLPYSFHLRMVNQFGLDFAYLLDDKLDMYTGRTMEQCNLSSDTCVTLLSACLTATFGHDLIEDCRISFNDACKHLGLEVAEIIYAVSNEKGKTRGERANPRYYEGIVETPGAVFVKLADRIANVQYGKMTKSSMFDKYKAENGHFIESLGYSENHPLKEMFDYLNSLFV